MRGTGEVRKNFVQIFRHKIIKTLKVEKLAQKSSITNQRVKSSLSFLTKMNFDYRQKKHAQNNGKSSIIENRFSAPKRSNKCKHQN